MAAGDKKQDAVTAPLPQTFTAIALIMATDLARNGPSMTTQTTIKAVDGILPPMPSTLITPIDAKTGSITVPMAAKIAVKTLIIGSPNDTSDA
ncbi:hypothetical protein CVT24_007787 [Panaeolus cyanescens]|uniref:Uncharacterized protein n=1 Tax=Panaeolus cyanescens TaxID=181874 RepID=A0A409YKM3_9AGAR|nr:hypothetical protein CVT24_007787 [Panaeolus cyanescens]